MLTKLLTHDSKIIGSVFDQIYFSCNLIFSVYRSVLCQAGQIIVALAYYQTERKEKKPIERMVLNIWYLNLCADAKCM